MADQVMHKSVIKLWIVHKYELCMSERFKSVEPYCWGWSHLHNPFHHASLHKFDQCVYSVWLPALAVLHQYKKNYLEMLSCSVNLQKVITLNVICKDQASIHRVDWVRCSGKHAAWTHQLWGCPDWEAGSDIRITGRWTIHCGSHSLQLFRILSKTCCCWLVVAMIAPQRNQHPVMKRRRLFIHCHNADFSRWSTCCLLIHNPYWFVDTSRWPELIFFSSKSWHAECKLLSTEGLNLSLVIKCWV